MVVMEALFTLVYKALSLYFEVILYYDVIVLATMNDHKNAEKGSSETNKIHART